MTLTALHAAPPQSIHLRGGELVLYRRSRSLLYQCRYRSAAQFGGHFSQIDAGWWLAAGQSGASANPIEPSADWRLLEGSADIH